MDINKKSYILITNSQLAKQISKATYIMNNSPKNIKRIQLKDLESKIKKERKWVDIKPYSHNIISLYLHAIDELEIEGVSGNDIIRKYNLTELGWEITDDEEQSFY